MGALEVPGYQLGEVLGRGGFASVYRAVQVAVGREVAVKIDNRALTADRDRRRFVREVTSAGRLSGHPHVVGVYDAGSLDDGRPYLVMELCPGGSLDAVVRRHGPMPAAAVRDIGVGVADALAAAHAIGVLHRDIKPANVLVNAYGVVGLSDFGLASILAADGDQSATREALTPAFAAPEAFALVDPTPAADIYSLSATLYMLLCGRPPRFPPDGSRPSLATIMAQHGEPLAELPIGEDFMSVLRRGLSPDPAQRWSSAGQLRDALASVRPLVASSVAPGPPPPNTDLGRSLRRGGAGSVCRSSPQSWPPLLLWPPPASTPPSAGDRLMRLLRGPQPEALVPWWRAASHPPAVRRPTVRRPRLQCRLIPPAGRRRRAPSETS